MEKMLCKFFINQRASSYRVGITSYICLQTVSKSSATIQSRTANVKLVLQIFNNYLFHALRELGEKYEIPHYLDTAAFIKIVTTWWNIVNAKNPHKTIRLNDDF